MHDLPESFLKRGLELADGARLFGKSFADMTRDELIAAAAQGWMGERKARDELAATDTARAAFFVELARLGRENELHNV